MYFIRVFTVAAAILGALFSSVPAQLVQPPVIDLIAQAKRSVLPVRATFYLGQKSAVATGTSVLIGSASRVFVLTCEHVVALKDSMDRTVKYADEITVRINLKQGTAVAVRAELLYTDEQRDFAILGLKGSDVPDSHNALFIQASRWQKLGELREGETAIYVGYPMGIGVEDLNYPLSRMGMVSQVIPRKTQFLLDGFVQHGHSGSPVFVVREIDSTLPPTWDIQLAGIARAFPPEYSKILEDVRFQTVEGVKALVNPGFTVVTGMDAIISVMREEFGVGK